jgi:hypothetical protein
MKTVADPEPAVSLCVFCGYRDAIDGDPCAVCMERRAVSEYLQKDQPRIQQRREQWRHWSDTADHARERQRRHRLLVNTRPRESSTAFDDPLELADRALESLQRVRQALRSNVVGRQHLDDACELVKQLGWGPQSVPSLPKAERKLPGGLVGMHNRWHVAAGKPCNCPPQLRSRTTP